MHVTTHGNNGLQTLTAVPSSLEAAGCGYSSCYISKHVGSLILKLGSWLCFMKSSLFAAGSQEQQDRWRCLLGAIPASAGAIILL